MILLFAKPIYIFIMALVLAILEVQIEGKDGWAAKLPTWRPKGNSWFVRLYKKIMGGKEMTGYHLSIFTFVLLIFHWPFFSSSWSLVAELKVLSTFFLFIIVWDYLWFVVNPKFTVKNFKGEHIFWHQRWLLGLPLDYWLAFSLSLLLAVITFFFCQVHFMEWLIMALILFVLTIATKVFIKKFIPGWE